MSYSFNNSLPGISGAGSAGNVLVSNGQAANWSVTSNVNSNNAITVKNTAGETVITFHHDGIIETASGKIHADEWIQITMIMKQFIMDVAKDEEFAKKYPYVKDMAHSWIMNELRK
jgi:hypothetical protein